MAGTPGALLAAVLLLASSSSSAAAGCPDPCSCPRETLLNCSSAGLSSAPRLLRDAVARLDLTQNLLEVVAFERPHPNLRELLLGGNGLVHLSLCVGGDPGARRRGRRRGPRPPGGRGCDSWAPGLLLLSLERNRLQGLPLGENTLICLLTTAGGNLTPDMRHETGNNDHNRGSNYQTWNK
ncbi:hypothetical protein EYF80_061250 [Liparis tanakae]|uniref:Uncharacterized protein n=1 Tax=Liparis tanakae TaxID=230148 RepID=A0A4Z2EIE7_9TELE|nr:hypothetical protein EYF80_061250 [Liparis tanakae]